MSAEHEQLLADLQNPNEATRLAAVKALGRQPDSQAVAPLLAILHSHSESLDLREAAALALGRQRDPQAITGLIELMALPTPEAADLKLSTLLGTGSTEMPAEVGTLSIADFFSQMANTVEDFTDDPTQQDFGRNFLNEISNMTGSGLRERLGEAARRGLRLAGAEALPALLDALKNENAELRRHAALALCSMDLTPTAFARVAATLYDPVLQVREAVRENLHLLLEDQTLERWQAALNDPSAAVRAEAALALGTWSHTGDTPASVRTALTATAEHDTDQRVRDLARLGLLSTAWDDAEALALAQQLTPLL